MKRIVIVGCGPAGLAAAATLRTAPDTEVWLLDAGGGPGGGSGQDRFPGQRWVLRGDPSRLCYLGGQGVGGGALINAGLLGPDSGATQQAGGRLAVPGPVGTAMRAGVPAARPTRVLERPFEAERFLAVGGLVPPYGTFHLGLGAVVNQVLVDGSTAVGVRTDRGELEADAVVMAAGAVSTPLLLLASGVEADGLGENLCDHPCVTVSFPVPASPAQLDGTRRRRSAYVSAVLEVGRGPADGRTREPDRAPSAMVYAIEDFGDGGAMVVDRNVEDDLATRRGGVIVALLDSSRRGTVSRCEVTGSTVVDLGEFDDRSRFAEIWRRVSPIFETPALAALVADATIDEWGHRLETLDSDDDIERWIRRSAGGLFHAAGTCSSAVEADGRIRGHRGLYVADISRLKRSPPWPMMASLASGRAVAEQLCH